LNLAHYLGRLNGEDCYALNAEGLKPTGPFSAQGLRSLYGQFDEETFSVDGRAVQIAAFGATHHYCGRCGAATARHPHERCVLCRDCGLSCYPRIAPAIIVLVRRGNEALLAHSARFPSAFYSALAGFVEPGEALEETLLREVREESTEAEHRPQTHRPLDCRGCVAAWLGNCRKQSSYRDFSVPERHNQNNEGVRQKGHDLRRTHVQAALGTCREWPFPFRYNRHQTGSASTMAKIGLAIPNAAATRLTPSPAAAIVETHSRRAGSILSGSRCVITIEQEPQTQATAMAG
jgi:hypothetical protein